MAQSKATKKFEKHRLPDVLKRRKEVAKVKQKHQMKAKKKARRAKDNEQEDNTKSHGAERPQKKTKIDTDSFDDLGIDDFFAKGLPTPKRHSNGKTGESRPGKRKRRDASEEDNDSSSVASVEEHAVQYSSGSEQDQDELDTHMADLKNLAQKDPEFHKYLQENDAELLDFAEDADLVEIDQLSNNDEEDEVEKTNGKTTKKKKDTSAGLVATKAMVKKWDSAMSEKHSLRAMREVVLAFRGAAHLNEETGKAYKYTISNAEVYHEVLLCALKKVPEVLNHHIPVKELPNGKIRVGTDTKKYQTLTPLMKSHAMSVQHLLENLEDDGTLTLTLTSLLALLPYTLSFKKVIRDLARSVVEIWSEQSRAEVTRIHAFLIMRRLIVIGDPSIKESVLRTIYQGLIKGSRTTTVHNLSGINLMKNSAAELWGLVESNIAYTTAFTFIRQLAIHLRNSIKNNANDSYKTIYNWQYIHSLDFWSRVLSTHCDTLREAVPALKKTTSNDAPASLRPLIYPVTQISLGTLRLIPTPAYFPLRFHLTRTLLRLSRTTNTYIPLAAPLYEVLASPELRRPAKPATLAPLDFAVILRAGKQYLRTRVYQEGAAAQTLELLAEFFALWCRSIAFPELALPVIVMLRRWLKDAGRHERGGPEKKGKQRRANRDGKVAGPVSLFVQKLEANSRWIEERRRKVDFAPNNRAGVEEFLKEVEWTATPMGAFVQGQRKMREEKERVLEEGRREEERRRKQEGREKETEKMAVDGFESDDEDVVRDNEDDSMED